VKLRWPVSQQWKSAAICAGATALLGLMCLIMPVRFWFERWSYDLPFLFASNTPVKSVVVIKKDEKSYSDLSQDYTKLWDRERDARLLDYLASDHAKLVVFDVWFSDLGDTNQNAILAKAIQNNKRVVLGMEYRNFEKLNGGEPIYPREEFREGAAACGITSILQDDADGVVRRIKTCDESLLTLAWAAATQAGFPTNQLKTQLQVARWLNYPSSVDQFSSVSYSEVLKQQPGYFSNKVVFVGSALQTKLAGQQSDTFPTPLGLWGGVFIQAMTFLNLIQGNWLERPSAFVEMLIVLFAGGICGLTLSLVRPWLGALVAISLLIILFAFACALTFSAHRWFSWAIVGAEVPFALGWSAFVQARRTAREKELIASELVLERQAVERLLPPTESEAATIRSDAADAALEEGPGGTVIVPQAKPAVVVSGNFPRYLPPSVPDHTLVRCIGEGGYGQVWLAQDVIGTYHAVKFVYRKTFNSAAPFDREFKGIHHFTPISRMHPGFVHILHVGRNEKAEYFFYIMELADDETNGQTILPESYMAKTLSRVIRTQGRLQPTECVKLGLQLSSALQYLHEHRLIHRDIKPSNVLYVHGQAKFADVGLVTEIHTRQADATYIGTEGYIAPEGPGTTAADLFSLGKVLYEASMGLDRMRFPDLPTAVVNEADPLVMRLNQIILKACEFDTSKRYKSAEELNNDLQALDGK
jgi:CHASE2 domain-containing sensor protein